MKILFIFEKNFICIFDYIFLTTTVNYIQVFNFQITFISSVKLQMC